MRYRSSITRSVSLIIISLRPLFFGVVIVSCIITRAQSQTMPDTTAVSSHISVGVIGGISSVVHETDFISFSNIYPGIEVADATGTGNWSGVSVEYWFPTNENALILNIFYDSKPGQFITFAGYANPGKSQKNGVVVDSQLNGWMDVELQYWTFHLALKHNFKSGTYPAGFGISLGPALGVLASGRLERTLTTQMSSGNPNSPIANETITRSDDIPGVNAIRLSVIGMLSYEINLFDHINIGVVAGADYPLTKVNTNYNWRTRAYFAGLSLRYYAGN